MAEQNNKQQRFVERGIEIASEADALYARIVAIMADLFANGYNDGGAAALVDGDFTGNADYLDAAAFYSGLIALQSLQTAFESGGTITALRKVKYE